MTARDPVRVFLDDIRDGWLQQCGSCDAGLAMTCTCPPGDPRNVIEKLAGMVEAVLALADEAEAEGATVHPMWIYRAVAAHVDTLENR